MHRLVSFRVQKNVRKAVDFLASTEDWQVPGRCRRMLAGCGKCLVDTDGCPHGVASAWQVPTDSRWCGKCLAPGRCDGSRQMSYCFAKASSTFL